MGKAIQKDEQTKAVGAALNLEEDAGQGLENMTAKDYAVPYFTILQSLSPQVIKGPERLEGAEAGDFYNSVSRAFFNGEKGVLVVPCAYQRKWVEWSPRESGGGFVQQHDTESVLEQCTRDEKNRDKLPNGNYIVATTYHYVLVINKEGMTEKAIIGMSSTQLKKARKWNSVISTIKLKGKNGLFTPPMFSHTYKLTSTLENNNQGSWFGWVIANNGLIEDPALYAEAKQFHSEIKKGLIKAQAPMDEDTGATEDTSDIM